MSTFDVVSFPPHYRPLPQGYVVVRTDDHYQWLKLTPDGRDYTAESCISVDRYSVRRGAFLHAEHTEAERSAAGARGVQVSLG